MGFSKIYRNLVVVSNYLLVFGLFLLINRLNFLIQNPDFFFPQKNETIKWLSLNPPIINIVTFLPLFLGVIYLLVIIVEIIGEKNKA